LILLGFIGPGIERLGTARAFVPEPYAGAGTVWFANGIVADRRLPATDSQLGCACSVLFDSGSYGLVHLAGPVDQEKLAELRAAGLEPVGYLAYQNVIVRQRQGPKGRGGKGLRDRVAQWPFRPEFKLAPELLALASADRSERSLVLALWPGEEPGLVAMEVAAVGGRVVALTDHTIVVKARADQVSSLARIDGVAYLQAAGRAESFNQNVQWVVQTGWHPEIPDPVSGRRVWAKGIRGQGMVVGLFDSGILTEHDMFRDSSFPLSGPGVFPLHRKIAAYKLYRDAAFGDAGGASYHGSGVAGTLAGNDSVNGNQSANDGMAPEARIYFVDNARASGQYVYYDDLTELLDSVRLSRGMTAPVPQVSGSFGSMDGLSYYRLADATADAVLWQDKRLLVVWAAGNGGGGRYKLGHPSCAKNVLTVGGCGNSIVSNEPYELSSAGPCRDGRIKPNIVAPADEITTVTGPAANAYEVREGTSFAAPAASGALVLLRQYLKEGWFPQGRRGAGPSIDRPSSALMRALAIAAADSNVGSDYPPNNIVGWGRLNLSRVMHFSDDSVALTFVDETVGLATGWFDEYEFELDRREPVRVVLAWTDTAAAPQAEIALVNDLNLELISPDNNAYRGNQLLEGQSLPNPCSWDERNVEEVCQLQWPLTGRWTIRVYGRNVFTARQPYALVVKGGIAGLPPAVEERASGPVPGGPVRRGATIVTKAKPLRVVVPAGARLRLFNAAGQEVADLRRMRCGVYYYRVEAPGTTPLTGKVVVSR